MRRMISDSPPRGGQVRRPLVRPLAPRGFTLVELLVVITIIGMMLG